MRDMLLHAYWRSAGPRGPDELPMWRYVSGWGRRGDAGYIALEGPNAVGAAWYRLFKSAEPGFGFVDDSTPELTLAAVPARRGQGFGHELMDGLLAHARADGIPALSLSAPKGATKLYERYGFAPVSEKDDTVTMRASL